MITQSKDSFKKKQDYKFISILLRALIWINNTPNYFDSCCNLCLEENIQIMLYPDPDNLLNQRCDLKIFLSNFFFKMGNVFVINSNFWKLELLQKLRNLFLILKNNVLSESFELYFDLNIYIYIIIIIMTCG